MYSHVLAEAEPVPPLVRPRPGELPGEQTLKIFTLIVGEFLSILGTTAKQFTSVDLQVCIKFYVGVFLVDIQGSNEHKLFIVQLQVIVPWFFSITYLYLNKKRFVSIFTYSLAAISCFVSGFCWSFISVNICYMILTVCCTGLHILG